MSRRRLTAARLRQLLNYDPDTGLFTWRIRPTNRVALGQVAGVVNGDGYRRIRLDGKDHFANRLAFLFVEGKHPTGQVRHINSDRADNRWANLRQRRRSPRGRARTPDTVADEGAVAS
jgi:hypothetical protein